MFTVAAKWLRIPFQMANNARAAGPRRGRGNRKLAYGRESAEVLALNALGWLAGESDEIGAFLNATGLARGDLAGLARDAGFLAAVLDFCLESDARVLACAAVLCVPPTALAEARMALPGGNDPHWT